MKTKIFRLLALSLALIMLVTAFAGCGKKDTDGDKKGDSSGKNEYSDEGIEFLVDPEDYKGTTVTFCTWRDPEKNEDGTAIKAFEEKYGIDVKIQMMEESAYVSLIAASIAAGTQGDVFFQNHSFPASLSVLQPLDAAKINYDDPIWRKSTFDASTIDGHKYLVDTISNVWSEMDICIYNKSLFEDNGITSPAEYYEAGNWTFETFEKACRDIASLGADYCGATVRGEHMLGAAGSSFFTFADNKLSVTADNKLYDIMHWLSKLNAEGIIDYGNDSAFPAGKVGMVIIDCFGLKKSGYYSNMNPEDLAATYTPRYDASSPQVYSHGLRGWGIIKGAKNPEAAGIFLREYLDVNNYDLEETFHNDDVANFFFQATNSEFEKTVYWHNSGVMKANGEINAGVIAGSIAFAWHDKTPDQIKAYLDSQKPVLENWCTTANTIITDARKYLEENH